MQTSKNPKCVCETQNTHTQSPACYRIHQYVKGCFTPVMSKSCVEHGEKYGEIIAKSLWHRKTVSASKQSGCSDCYHRASANIVCFSFFSSNSVRGIQCLPPQKILVLFLHQRRKDDGRACRRCRLGGWSKPSLQAAANDPRGDRDIRSTGW